MGLHSLPVMKSVFLHLAMFVLVGILSRNWMKVVYGLLVFVPMVVNRVLPLTRRFRSEFMMRARTLSTMLMQTGRVLRHQPSVDRIGFLQLIDYLRSQILYQQFDFHILHLTLGMSIYLMVIVPTSI